MEWEVEDHQNSQVHYKSCPVVIQERNRSGRITEKKGFQKDR